MLADHADACNRRTRHVVERFVGLSVAKICGVHARDLSRVIHSVCWYFRTGPGSDDRRWIVGAAAAKVMVEA
jgi:hypothetical protein